MTTGNERIEREKQFHDRRYTNDNQRQQKILQNSKNSQVIRYGYGKGSYAFKIAKNEAKLVTGIDISSIAIKTAI